MRSIRRTLTALILMFLAAAGSAAAKEYSAERFDSHMRVLADGTLDVTETIVIRFEDGTFTYFFRNVSKRNTDGIQIVGAEMDGRSLPFGKNAGEVEVRSGSPVRVRWHFAPRSGTTHTFVLTYRVRGVVKREGHSDVLDWPALPKEHDYRIASSDITIEYPAPLSAPPRLATRRVGEFDLTLGELRVQAISRGIGRNGWVQPRIEFESGSVLASLPVWQQRQLRNAAQAPRWMLAAGLIFVCGMVLIVLLRQGYDSPLRETWNKADGVTPPDTLRPALAGALASNGGIALQHAMATLVALADRGAVTISEEPRKWGQRNFLVRRRPGAQPMAPEEQTILDLAFHDRDRPEEAVPLAKVRGRIGGRGFRKFSAAVRRELTTLGVFDSERAHIRTRYRNISVMLILLASVLVIPAAILAREFGGWPFLIPGATGTVAVVGFIFYGALTPLSNEGSRRARAWRAYQKHLRDVTRDRAHLTTDSPTHLLSIAIALGLAGLWSKYLKKTHSGIPPWFKTLTAADDGAFPAFIAAGGAGADGGGAGGVSAGAGASGGASGAG